MKFDVIIAEQLQRIVTIDALSKEDAALTARKKYQLEDIILDADDWESTTFTVNGETIIGI